MLPLVSSAGQFCRDGSCCIIFYRYYCRSHLQSIDPQRDPFFEQEENVLLKRLGFFVPTVFMCNEKRRYFYPRYQTAHSIAL